VPPAPSLAPPHAQVAAARPAPATGDTAVPPPAAGSPSQASPPAPPQPNSPSLSSGNVAAAATQDVAKPDPAVPGDAAPGQVYGSKNAAARVVLRARAATHVTVRGRDGTVFINRDLSPGDSYRVPNVVGLSLAVSDASAMDVMLDGKVLGSVAKNPENLDEVSLSPASLVDRFNSH
jgi:cytoskeleton protein RodZ